MAKYDSAHVSTHTRETIVNSSDEQIDSMQMDMFCVHAVIIWAHIRTKKNSCLSNVKLIMTPIVTIVDGI